jgi:ABC-type multidrug transport system permease subunit
MSRFLLNAWLSYRALFTWLNPWGYVSSRLVAPLALSLIFAGIAVHGGKDPTPALVGGAVLAAARACTIGLALAVMNERQFGTLGLWLCSPQGLLRGLLGKGLPHLVDGVVSAAVVLVAGLAVFGAPAHLDAFALLFLLVVGAFAGLCAGVVATAISLRLRDVFTAPNVIASVILLCSGVFVPRSQLPAFVDWLGPFLPLSHLVDYSSGLLSGAGGSSPAWEIVVDVAWALIGYASLHHSFRQAKLHATLDRI